MYAVFIETFTGLFERYGVFVLLLAFVLEGALVGKVIPTRVLFVGSALAVGSDAFGLTALIAAAVVGGTIGQIFLFGLVRRTDIDLQQLPGSVEKATGTRLSRWVDRWGLPAVAISNAMPVARGSLTVPLALSNEDALRFSSAALVGTSMYAIGLVAVATGLDVALGVL